MDRDTLLKMLDSLTDSDDNPEAYWMLYEFITTRAEGPDVPDLFTRRNKIY